MPERVRTKFDDDASEVVEPPVKKRKIDNVASHLTSQRQPKSHLSKEIRASRDENVTLAGESEAKPKSTSRSTPPTTGLLSKHRQALSTQPKVIYFGDDSDESQVKLDSVASSPVHKGRLKQRAQDLLQLRQKLPIWPHSQEIQDKLAAHDVLLLVGETGSGKSTQIPQFLLDACQNVKQNGIKVGGTIAITQPRRVAAISLARRVAEEMGTPLGNSSPASQVGYSVRFDNSTSPSTRVKFLTDGMLLQELLRDPWLKEYSVVIVDEVHERGLNVDLVLGFLKRLIEGRNKNDGRGGVPLKVVVMSATADMERIQGFFTGTTSASNETGEYPDDGDDGDSSREKVVVDAKAIAKVASCFIKGRQYPVKIHYTPQPVQNTIDAAMEKLMHIHAHTPLPGDILVFLPGQETIDSLESMCKNYAQTLISQSKQKGAPRVPKLLILPLFAALPTALQQRVFESTPPFTRKIILSTNIAETSVTVPGIRHVIDTGKRKARFFRPSLNLDTLLSKPISRSSANQRAGRAGREAPGNCYRLYTEKSFYELSADTEPEVLRCDLSQLVLTLKAHSIDNPLSFPLLTPPPMKALERALLHLLRLGALDRKTGGITSTGKQMSRLPLPANLARILLASQQPQNDCTAEIIDIVSALSVENIWLPLHNKSNPTQQPSSNPVLAAPNAVDNDDINSDSESNNPVTLARATLHRREGDHLTLLAALQSYTAEPSNRKEWCHRHGVNHRAISSAMDIRRQLTKLFAEGGRFFTPSPSTSTSKPQSQPSTPAPPPKSSSSSSPPTPLPTRILKTLLTGLSENTARLTPHSNSNSNTNTDKSNPSIWTGPYTTYNTSKSLQVHPSSVLFARPTKPPVIMFSEFVVTGRAYARGVSAIEAEWIDEVTAPETNA